MPQCFSGAAAKSTQDVGVREQREVASLEDLPTLEPIAHATPQGFLGKTFSSLRHANYRYLWFGTVFMSAGQWIQQVTLGWLLYDLTGSSVLLGALNGLRALPFLIASPIAGVVADRTDRKKILTGYAIRPDDYDRRYGFSRGAETGGGLALVCFYADHGDCLGVHRPGAPEHGTDTRA